MNPSLDFNKVFLAGTITGPLDVRRTVEEDREVLETQFMIRNRRKWRSVGGIERTREIAIRCKAFGAQARELSDQSGSGELRVLLEGKLDPSGLGLVVIVNRFQAL